MSNAVETRANYPWLLKIPTRWIDNDLYGHMNNAVYYSFYENAIMSWLEVEQQLDANNGPVKCFTVENGCRYYSALRYPGDVECGLRIAKLGNSSVKYELGLFDAQSDSVAATGFVVDVFVDATTERPVSIPDQFRSAYQLLMVRE